MPAGVRVMQDELKMQLQEIISQQYEQENRIEGDQRQFLQKYGLPQQLHAVSSASEIPQQLCEKIEDFQKNGGINKLTDMMEGIRAIRDNNSYILSEMTKLLDQEEKSDKDMRAQYGDQKWTRKDSASLNGAFRF